MLTRHKGMHKLCHQLLMCKKALINLMVHMMILCAMMHGAPCDVNNILYV